MSLQSVTVYGRRATLDQKNDGVLTITHEPVPEWGWPAMTMDFDLSPEVGIRVFDEGQVIRFEMEKNVGWRLQGRIDGKGRDETMKRWTTAR